MPGTGEAAREPAEGTAVRGRPATFTIPGRVPAVAVSFRTDGSLITVEIARRLADGRVGVRHVRHFWPV